MSILKDNYYLVSDVRKKFPNLAEDYIRHLIRKYGINIQRVGKTIIISEDQLEIFEIMSRLEELKPKKKVAR